jgi:S-adenosylmethionine:tRNA ribosyltransferase-isomerase
MLLEEFNFELPEDLIAQFPADKRDESKLLVLNRKTGDIKDRKFKDIIDFLKDGDLLVLNNSKVTPLKLIGKRENGKQVELLLVNEIDKNNWSFLSKKPARFKDGEKIVFSSELFGTIGGWSDKEHRIISFEEGILNKILSERGLAPLPPYIKRKNPYQSREFDLKRYQTIYAKKGVSIAAPTAGLHFTEEIIGKLKTKGVEFAEITLNVGEATFQPVRVKKIEEHKMKYESFEITGETADKINNAIKKGKRIIAVGTTSVRTLESSYSNGKILKGNYKSNLFIYPGYEFKIVKGIITNFHLPKSTLFMLVSAWTNLEMMQKTYKYAINNRYRFFSYGDSMLIL